MNKRRRLSIAALVIITVTAAWLIKKYQIQFSIEREPGKKGLAGRTFFCINWKRSRPATPEEIFKFYSNDANALEKLTQQTDDLTIRAKAYKRLIEIYRNGLGNKVPGDLKKVISYLKEASYQTFDPSLSNYAFNEIIPILCDEKSEACDYNQAKEYLETRLKYPFDEPMYKLSALWTLFGITYILEKNNSQAPVQALKYLEEAYAQMSDQTNLQQFLKEISHLIDEIKQDISSNRHKYSVTANFIYTSERNDNPASCCSSACPS